MPEGASSIADLQIVIDTSAEAFHTGITGVLGALEQVGASGKNNLGKLDDVLAMAGNAALSFRGKFALVAASVEQAMAVYQQFAEQGRAVAEQMGVTAEYDRLIATIDDLGMSLRDAAVGALFAVSSAGQQTASAMLGFSSATDTAETSADKFAQRLLNNVSSALDQVRLKVRLFNADATADASELDKTLELARRRIQEIEEEKRRAEALGGSGFVSGSRQSAAALAVRQEIDALEDERTQLERRIAELTDRRASLPGVAWADGTEVVKSAIGDQIQALDQQIATFGMASAALAEYTAYQKAYAQALREGIVITEQWEATTRAEAAEVGAKTLQLEQMRAAQAAATEAKARDVQLSNAERAIFANAEADVRGLENRAKALTLNAEAAATLVYYEKLLQQLRGAGVEIGAQEELQALALAQSYGRRSEELAAGQRAVAGARSGQNAFEAAEREIKQAELKASAVGLNAEATARLAMEERLLDSLRQAGQPITEAHLARIQALGDRLEYAMQQTRLYTQMMQTVSEVGSTVAGELQGAFAKWTSGTKIDVKEMVGSILQDLAQLAFRRGVLDQLFGGGGSAVGTTGGLLGSLVSTLFGGARADGGPVDQGRAYLVGERGPELFVPDNNGRIDPRGAGGAGGEIIVTVRPSDMLHAEIDARAEGVVTRAAPGIAAAAVSSTKKNLPSMMSGAQRRAL